jgi:hypothetical protein
MRIIFFNHIRFEPTLEEDEKKPSQSNPFPFFSGIHPFEETLKKICYLWEAIKDFSLPDGKRISSCFADGELVAKRLNRP